MTLPTYNNNTLFNRVNIINTTTAYCTLTPSHYTLLPNHRHTSNSSPRGSTPSPRNHAPTLLFPSTLPNSAIAIIAGINTLSY
jgi:hypothetical protein